MTTKKENTIIFIISVLIIILMIFFVKSLSLINQNNYVSQEQNNNNQKTAETETKKKNVENENTNKQKTEYLNESQAIMNDFTKSLDYLSQLLINKSLPIYWNETELTMAALSSVYIEQSYDKIIKLTPPKELVEMHNLLLSALKKYKQAMPLFRQGVDNLDAQKINQSTTLMIEGASLMEEATVKGYKLIK